MCLNVYTNGNDEFSGNQISSKGLSELQQNKCLWPFHEYRKKK